MRLQQPRHLPRRSGALAEVRPLRPSTASAPTKRSPLSLPLRWPTRGGRMPVRSRTFPRRPVSSRSLRLVEWMGTPPPEALLTRPIPQTVSAPEPRRPRMLTITWKPKNVAGPRQRMRRLSKPDRPGARRCPARSTGIRTQAAFRGSAPVCWRGQNASEAARLQL